MILGNNPKSTELRESQKQNKRILMIKLNVRKTYSFEIWVPISIMVLKKDVDEAKEIITDSLFFCEIFFFTCEMKLVLAH